MKLKNKVIISITLILFTILIANNSNAAVEIKAYTASTAKQIDAYQMCLDMKDPTSTLGVNTLDPHLLLGKEYGALAYLSMSAYGNNDIMSWHSSLTSSSTTTNKTGVLFSGGGNARQMVATVLDMDETTEMGQNYGNTKYLETFSSRNDLMSKDSTKGMAIAEINGWYGVNYTIDSIPNYNWFLVRSNTHGTSPCNETYDIGALDFSDTIYFRPAIWN